jgi:hypothetical protein
MKIRSTKLAHGNNAAATSKRYEPDDGPLSDDDNAWLRQYAQAHLPKGRPLRRRSLLGIEADNRDAG